MYWKKFPKTTYDFKAVGLQNTEVLDILTRVRFLFDDLFSKRVYTTYTLQHGDTVDTIAHDIYGRSDWWWLVLLYNDIINPFVGVSRLGRDVQSFKRPTKVFYIERTDGDPDRDFMTNDIIVKGSGTATNYEGNRGYDAPLPIGDEDKRAAVSIDRFDADWRRGYVSGKYVGRFEVGDTVMVLEKEEGSLSQQVRPVVWGTILSILEEEDEIVDIIDNTTGRSVPPTWNIQTKQVEGHSPLLETTSFSDTVIGGILGMAGSSGNTYDSLYTGVIRNEQESAFESAFNVNKTRIKLLDPSYKDEAYSLLLKALNSNRGDVHTFSTEKTLYRTTPFTILGGSGKSSTQRIY